jgi:microcompartment protein CcmL/EutN
VEGPFFRRQGEGATVAGPALGLIETASVARGLVVVDAMVKRAPVTLVLQRTVSPGKHVVLVSGAVAEVEEAMRAGVEIAARALVDRLELAQVADGLLRALAREAPPPPEDDTRALGIVETLSLAASLLAADAAAKAAAVEIVELRLGDGLGGKAYFVLAGEQADVEAGLFAAETAIAPALLVGRELIARPHVDLLQHLKR